MYQLVLLSTFFVGGIGDAPSIAIDKEIKAHPSRNIILKVKTDCKKVNWIKPVEDCDLIVFPDTKTAIFLAPNPGVYRVIVYTAAGDEPSDPAVCTITVGNQPPPTPVPPTPVPPTPVPPTPVPPTPNPTPPVPVPDDPLVTKLRAIFKTDEGADGEKKVWLQSYSDFLLATSEHAMDRNMIKTVSDLRSDYRVALDKSLPATALIKLRTECVKEFITIVDDAEKVLSDDERKKLSDILKKLSAAVKVL